MATSGVEVDAEVTREIDLVKTRKKRFCFFKISDDNTKIESTPEGEEKQGENLVDMKGAPEEEEEKSKQVMKDITTHLKENKTIPRYIYLNIVLNNKGRTVDKLILIVYNPDDAKIKQKMMYSSSKDALKKVIPGTFVDLQASDLDELDDFKELRSTILTKSGST